MSGGWIKVMSKRERKHQEEKRQKHEKFLLARDIALKEIKRAMAVVSQMKSIIINMRKIDQKTEERKQKKILMEKKKEEKKQKKETNALHRLLSGAFEKAMKEEIPMVRYFLFEPCSPVLTWDHLICVDFC